MPLREKDLRWAWVRRALVVTLVVVFGLAIAACGGDDDAAAPPPAPAADEPAPAEAPAEPAEGEGGLGLFVAYEDGSCGNSLRVHNQAEFEDFSMQNPDIERFVYSCGEGDVSKGIANIQALTAQGVDIIVTLPDQGDALVPAIREATEQGVTVVPWTIPLTGEGEAFCCQVVDDLDARGVQAARYFIDKIGSEGVVVGVGGTPGNSFDLPQIEAMERTFAEEAPGMEFADMAWADWNPAKSAESMATLLTKHPQIDGVWTLEGTTVIPEIEQFLAAGRPLPVFFSNDVNGAAGAFLELKPDNPTLEMGFLSSRTWGVRNAMEVALQAHKGEEIDTSLLVIDNFVTDCSEECADLYLSDWPDSYIPTHGLSDEARDTILKPLLEE